MIKIIPDPAFMAVVNITVPGQAETASIELQFRHMGRAALKEWMEKAGDKADAALLDEIIAGWGGVVSPDGADMPYSLTALDELLDKYPSSGKEIVMGYVFALTESRVKNSGGLLAA